jgi:hypothetical protein
MTYRWILVLPIAALAIPYSLHLVGVCYSSASVLDSELIAEVMMNEDRRGEFPTSIYGPSQAVAYVSKHPDCCTVDRWHHPFMSNQLLNSLFGTRNFAVTTVYPRKHPDAEGASVKAVTIVRACGQVVDRYAMIKD